MCSLLLSSDAFPPCLPLQSYLSYFLFLHPSSPPPTPHPPHLVSQTFSINSLLLISLSNRDVWFYVLSQCRAVCIQTWRPLKSELYSLSPSRACVGARDPYCGWDLLLKKCTTLEESVRMSQWEQSITKCPVSCCLILFTCLWLGLLVCLYSHFNIGIENTIIHTQPLCSPLLLNLTYSSALLSSESYNLLHTLPVHSQLASSSP